MGVVLQMVQQNDDKHEKGHSRLRDDYRELEKRVMALERAYTETVLDFTRTKAEVNAERRAPIDVGKIVFNPRMMLAVVGLALSTVTGNSFVNWWMGTPIRQDIAAMRTDMIANAKVQDERASSNKLTLDKLERNGTLQQMKIDEITTALKVRGIIR